MGTQLYRRLHHGRPRGDEEQAQDRLGAEHRGYEPRDARDLRRARLRQQRLGNATQGLRGVSQTKIFDSETVLPDGGLTAKARTLLGFDARYARVRDQLRLLLNIGELGSWNKKHHGGKLAL